MNEGSVYDDDYFLKTTNRLAKAERELICCQLFPTFAANKMHYYYRMSPEDKSIAGNALGMLVRNIPLSTSSIHLSTESRSDLQRMFKEVLHHCPGLFDDPTNISKFFLLAEYNESAYNSLLRKFRDRIKWNKILALQAIHYHPDFYNRLPKDLQDDDDVILEAILPGRGQYYTLGERLQLKCKEISLKAIQKNAAVSDCCNPEWLSGNEFLLEMTQHSQVDGRNLHEYLRQTLARFPDFTKLMKVFANYVRMKLEANKTMAPFLQCLNAIEVVAAAGNFDSLFMQHPLRLLVSDHETTTALKTIIAEYVGASTHCGEIEKLQNSWVNVEQYCLATADKAITRRVKRRRIWRVKQGEPDESEDETKPMPDFATHYDTDDDTKLRRRLRVMHGEPDESDDESIPMPSFVTHDETDGDTDDDGNWPFPPGKIVKRSFWQAD